MLSKKLSEELEAVHAETKDILSSNGYHPRDLPVYFSTIRQLLGVIETLEKRLYALEQRNRIRQPVSPYDLSKIKGS